MPKPGSVPKIRTDLAYYGVVTRLISATQFVVAGLAGLGDGALVGYATYVMAKADGTITPPHAEQPPVTAYVSSVGIFTHIAYTAPLAVGDQLLLLHPNISFVSTLLDALISYRGTSTLAGNGLGTTLVCADLVNEPNYAGLPVKILDGGAAGQVRQIASHIGNTITVAAAFTNAAGGIQQIAAGTRFDILSITGGAAGPPPVPPPSVGLWMFGICDPGMAASPNTLVVTNLAGFNDDIFNTEFWVQVIHNADVPGAAPEREIRRVTDYVGATGTFTCDDFSANVEANDLVCVFHESIMAVEILGYGTIDTSSATVPADSTRPGLYAWEVNNYFRGCLLMTTEGAARFAPRRIVEYTNATGVFTLDPNNPFPAASGDVDYIIIGDQTEFVPAVDAVINRTPADVIGGKADTPIYSAAFDVSSVIRYLKGLMAATITAWGTADAGSGIGLIRDAARTEIDDWWNGQTVLMLTGAAAFQKRPITDFLAVTDDIIVAPNFDGAVGAGDIYVILAHYNMIVPRAADDVANALTSQVIGRKDDTALFTAAANATLMRYVKGLITAGIAVQGAVSDAGPAITDFDTTLTEVTDDHYNGMLLLFIDGPNAGQAHNIEDYAGGARNVSFRAGDRWTDVPVDANTFVILPSSALALQTALDTIAGLVDSAETVGPFSYLDAGGEQDVVEDTATTRRRIWLEFSNRNMTQTGTFKVYRMVNGANYDLYASEPVLIAAGEDRAFDIEFTTNQAWKLTYEEDVDEGAARDIPFNVLTQVIE